MDSCGAHSHGLPDPPRASLEPKRWSYTLIEKNYLNFYRWRPARRFVTHYSRCGDVREGREVGSPETSPRSCLQLR
jgi:hypothetical protein